MHSHEKTQDILHVRFVWDISISGVGIGLHRFFPKTLNSIKLCWNKSKKMQRLNNDERNQVIGILIAGMSAVTVVSWHFGCTRKTIERLRRQFRVTGNVQPICVYPPYFGQILTRPLDNKAGLVPPSPALPTWWLGFDFAYRWMSV